MPRWIVDWMRWVLLAAGIAGLVAAGLAWQGAQHIGNVSKNGADAVARVESAKRTHTKGLATVVLNLSWKDDGGKLYKAREVPVTRAFGDRIVKEKKLLILAVPIRYIKGQAEAMPVVVPDAARLEVGMLARFHVLGSGGIVALLCGLLLLVFGRRAVGDSSKK